MKNQFEIVLGKLLSEERFNEELISDFDQVLKKNSFNLTENEKSRLKEILKNGFEMKVGNEQIVMMCGSCCAAGGPCEVK
jgi:hypothetical protein